jgi:23S rRNA (cytosine1962-C5)-methyltransferase
MIKMGYLVLKKGRERSLLQRHPWIFSGAIERFKDVEQNGETVDIRSFGGETVAVGSFSEFSQIVARVWTFESNQKIDKQFLRLRILNANNLRLSLNVDKFTNAYRILNAEADGIPGLIVDKYGDYLVCQFLSAGAEFWRSEIIEILITLLDPAGIFERSDADSRTKEGFEKKSGIIFGNDPPSELLIIENEMKYNVDIKSGHKTGFYLDQRENRRKIKDYSQGKDVLNCFSYTGGFGITALANGATKVTNIDSSAESLKMIEKNIALNNLDLSRSEQVEGDVFKILRSYRDSGNSFDLIVLDPPKFAESKNQLEGALRGYKDINLLAFKLLKPGGILFTFSCSGHIVPELFRKVVSDAAIDSGRTVQLLESLQQAADHPIMMNFPESFYLKGLICKVW